jgi:hypothetical protein
MEGSVMEKENGNAAPTINPITIMRQPAWMWAMEWIALAAIAFFLCGILTTTVESETPITQFDSL